MSWQLDRLRELSCDDHVVRCNGKRKSYALALLDYAANGDPWNHVNLRTLPTITGNAISMIAAGNKMGTAVT